MPKPGCPEQSGLCDDAATFLLWKVARPQAEHPLKNETEGSPLRGEFLSERSERNQRIAGGWDFKERPAAYALVFQESHPRTPFFTGEQDRVCSVLFPALG